MEYKKGERGFTLEFNELEEMNLERFISSLKEHDEFSGLSSNSEFLALILNEGVSSLQQKTNAFTEIIESGSTASFQGILASLLNENFAALQHEPVHLMTENGRPISFNELLNLLPDFDSFFQEIDQPIEEDESAPNPNEPLSSIQNNFPEGPPKESN
ncbi:hypothetical protein F7731_17885 [Cytobacillus depressus]|uniref:Uncharacterized protein n=1 Tax=Cytobacillus depressus TaxID=1602942 RepID=A0A6L3V3R9_9BACI|nr:hypothetical protein [Cytobacillus depressus]KAB2332157.1 hypothetical protein F7731_17885 [Cytobacillus depressus]